MAEKIEGQAYRLANVLARAEIVGKLMILWMINWMEWVGRRISMTFPRA